MGNTLLIRIQSYSTNIAWSLYFHHMMFVMFNTIIPHFVCITSCSSCFYKTSSHRNASPVFCSVIFVLIFIYAFKYTPQKIFQFHFSECEYHYSTGVPYQYFWSYLEPSKHHIIIIFTIIYLKLLDVYKKYTKYHCRRG